MTSEQRDVNRAKAFRTLGMKARGGSYLERKVRWFLEQQGIAFEAQWPFRLDGKQRYADFYLPGARVVIECDGPFHDTPEAKDKDAARDKALRSIGVGVLRFDQTAIMQQFSGVADSIQAHCCFVPIPVRVEHRRLRGGGPRNSTPPMVFHLSVDEDRSFIAGGIIVHNCDECAALDGEQRPLDHPFSSGDTEPPLHPSCRCAVGLVPPGESVQQVAPSGIVDIPPELP